MSILQPSMNASLEHLSTADRQRRPSEIRRVPAPKISREELAVLATLPQPTPPTFELHYLDNDSSVSLPVPYSTSTPVSNNTNLLSALRNGRKLSYVSSTTVSTPACTPLRELSRLDFPVPPLSPVQSTPVIPLEAPRKMSVPPEVHEDLCGCRSAVFEEEDGSVSSSEPDSVDHDHEVEDSANATRLSHYRWASVGHGRATSPISDVPHSRTVTEETDQFAAVPRPSVSSSTYSSVMESIFDSYNEEANATSSINRHDSNASALTNPSTFEKVITDGRTYNDGKPFGDLPMRGESDNPYEPVITQGNNKFSSVMSELRESFTRNRVKSHRERDEDGFSSYIKPSEEALRTAADTWVYTEHGEQIRFGELWEGQKTIVCFIRHYWCPSCQDYIASVMRITPEQLRQLNLKLIIVGCGSPKMIAGYRKLLGGCTYPIVTDPTRSVYRHFGMTFSTYAAGRRGAYVQHGTTVNTLISLKRNMVMPLKNPGDIKGLGGEFVVGPGLSCTYAHRMRTSRDHAELSDILKAIGITLPLGLAQSTLTNTEVDKQGSVIAQRSVRKQSRTPMVKEGRVINHIFEEPTLSER